jgi:hypothetical protein
MNEGLVFLIQAFTVLFVLTIAAPWVLRKIFAAKLDKTSAGPNKPSMYTHFNQNIDNEAALERARMQDSALSGYNQGDISPP